MSSGMTSPPPVNKLPKIPKLKSPKKEPTSPLKSPSKGANSHKTKEEPISPVSYFI